MRPRPDRRAAMARPTDDDAATPDGVPDLKRASAKRATSANRPVTASYLRNAAMHYLAQRAASTAMVREALERRARRRLGTKRLHEEVSAMVTATVEDLARLGLVDDVRFAEGRAATLASRGVSKAHIARRLEQKGIERSTAAQVGAAQVDDLAQARRTIERKRLGPFRRGGESEETRRKDLAALARSGFSYGVAVAALAAAAREAGER